MRTFAKFMYKSILVLMTSTLAVSCYDDGAIWDQLEMLTDKVFALEERLNNEISALEAMLKGKIFVTNVSTDAASGITTVTLSNGTQLQLLPEKDLKSFLTYFENAAGKHWAYIDENGKVVPFYDEKGGLIPIESSFPSVIEKDGETYIVIGGKEYPMSGNSVFSDYELVTDELTGEVYAVTFTFGEDMTFTVTVDGACGFYFVQASGWSSEIIDNYYVENGHTERVQIDARGVVDYVLQIPDGWRVKEYQDVFMGTRYFDITAPFMSVVEMGLAVAEGELKVVAVLEGGKATVAKLNLSSSPFKTFSLSLGKAYVEMYNGLQKYVYGMCLASEYDEATVFETASSLLEAYDYPAGYNVTTNNLKGVDVAAELGIEPVAGSEYVFWAIPALYYATDEDAGYYLEEGLVEKVEFKYNSVTFEVDKPSFLDAELKMELVGVDAYYTALVTEDEYLLEDVLYCLNNSYYDAQTEPMTYNGSLFDFAGVEAQSATKYVAWLAVAEAGKVYTEADLVVCKFSTASLTAGGKVDVEAAEPVLGPLDVTVELTATGANSIYYAFMTKNEASKYTDDEAKAKYLFEKGGYAGAQTATAKASDFIAKTKPETAYTLFAVASDSEGKYGKVLVLECKTTAITYNNMTVAFELVKNAPNNVQVAVSTTGGDAAGYLYWVGKTSDNTWKSSTYLGGSAETAQVYMYLNSENYRFTNIADAYPVVDGVIKMTDLSYDVEYVIVGMAKDANGGFSKATEFKFTTRAVDLGTVVYSTESKWAAAKPTIEFIQAKSYPAAGQMPGAYAFNITIPANFTAYVLAGTDSYISYGEDESLLTVEDKIIRIIENVDRGRDWQITEDYWEWPDIGITHYHSEHGCELWGNSIIWASLEYHDSVCDCGGVFEDTKVLNGKNVTFHHVLNINDGNPIEFRMPNAAGSTTEIIDKVFVVCQDLQSNCYEPFIFDVPIELFLNGGSRDEM